MFFNRFRLVTPLISLKKVKIFSFLGKNKKNCPVLEQFFDYGSYFYEFLIASFNCLPGANARTFHNKYRHLFNHLHQKCNRIYENGQYVIMIDNRQKD